MIIVPRIFLGAGHGKGIPDGIGGTVKRAADRVVKFGTNICNAHQFVQEVSKSSAAIHLYEVTKDEILLIRNSLSVTNLKSVPGTMKLHQIIFSNQNCIDYRNVSCVCHKGDECNENHVLKHHTFRKGNKCDCGESVHIGAKTTRQRPSRPTRNMQCKNVCQNNDEDIPVTRSEEQIADDAFETVGEPECVVGDSERMSEPGCDVDDSEIVGERECVVGDSESMSESGCGVDDSETVGEPECVVGDSERMSEPGCGVDDSETVGEPECVVGDSERMSEPGCVVGDCERMDGPECASNYDAVKYLTCLRNLRVTESFDDFIQECQSQMSEMRLREVCGRGRSVLENRITIENWAIASVPSDIPGQSHQPFPVKVR